MQQEKKSEVQISFLITIYYLNVSKYKFYVPIYDTDIYTKGNLSFSNLVATNICIKFSAKFNKTEKETHDLIGKKYMLQTKVTESYLLKKIELQKKVTPHGTAINN